MRPPAESLDRAAEFLSAATQGRPGRDVPLRRQLQGLFGLWLAERAEVRSAAAPADALASIIRDAVARDSARGTFDPYAYDAKLLMLCDLAMRERGVASPQLSAFFRELAEAFRTLAVIPVRLAGEALLLECLDETPLGDGARVEAAVAEPAGSLLRADSAIVRELCANVAGASLFGSRPVEADERVVARLPILLLQTLRDYDLTLGAAVLRTLAYLDMHSCEEVAYATEYLLCQQQDDGRFGYYARELSEGPALEDADLDLYLPVSVSVLWALVEVSVVGFRLVVRPRAPHTRKPPETDHFDTAADSFSPSPA